MNEQPVYRHVQRGDGLRIFLLVVAAALLVPAFPILRHPARLAEILIVASAMMLIAAVVFTKLTIEVTAADLRWYFGFGFPSGTISRADVTRVSIAKPGLFNGIGVHLTLRGWLWNVSLGTAVEVERTAGADVLLGTDDPQGLLAALARDA